GGTLAALFIKFPLSSFFNCIADGLKAAFSSDLDGPRDIINTATYLAALVRKRGRLALEDAPVRNSFFHKGAQMIADGHDATFIRQVLTKDMNSSIETHQLSERFFRAIGDSAPAFGMIGTLVGLVQMLSNMQDPESLTMGMAVALLTTLYGSLIAHLFAIPIADKLQMRAQNEYQNKALIIESILNILEQRNPKLMEELLMSHLPDRLRELGGDIVVRKTYKQVVNDK
ncbi:MAG: MotA/TolQ/ExbB proton channel family protein, partial [Gammaproteobacteria bacterium]|nr:MotA/TolQ/ExbB proton channel family protein [Gammaproteobacteria bacterium]